MELVENDTNNQPTFLGEEQLRHVKPGASTKYNELEQNELAAESHWLVMVSVILFCLKLNVMYPAGHPAGSICICFMIS